MTPEQREAADLQRTLQLSREQMQLGEASGGSNADPGAELVRTSSAHTHLLIEMGYSPSEARLALSRTGNRGVQSAVEWLLANPDVDVGDAVADMASAVTASRVSEISTRAVPATGESPEVDEATAEPMEEGPSFAQDIECPICFETLEGTVKLPACGHKFCDACWAEHVNTKIQSGEFLHIRCPAIQMGGGTVVSCKREASVDEVRAVFDEAVSKCTFAKFQQFREEQILKEDKSVVWCPKPGCETAIRGYETVVVSGRSWSKLALVLLLSVVYGVVLGQFVDVNARRRLLFTRNSQASDLQSMSTGIVELGQEFVEALFDRSQSKVSFTFWSFVGAAAWAVYYSYVTIVHPTKPWKGKKSTCTKCQHSICYDCRQPFHPRLECEEVEDYAFQQWAKGRDAGRCPSCKVAIERTQGCNHMTCRVCKHEFCWLCGADYAGGRHFSGTGCQQFGGMSKHQLESTKETTYISLLWIPTAMYTLLQSRAVLVLLLAIITDGSWLSHTVNRVGPLVPAASFISGCLGGLLPCQGDFGFVDRNRVVRFGPGAAQHRRATFVELQVAKFAANIVPHLTAPYCLLLGTYCLSKCVSWLTWILSFWFIPLPYFGIRFLIFLTKLFGWFIGIIGTGLGLFALTLLDLSIACRRIPGPELMMAELNSRPAMTMYLASRMLLTQLHCHVLYTAAGYQVRFGFAPLIAFALGWMFVSGMLTALRDIESRNDAFMQAPGIICSRILQFVPLLMCVTMLAAIHLYVRPYEISFAEVPNNYNDLSKWLGSALCDDCQVTFEGCSHCFAHTNEVEGRLKLAGYSSVEDLFTRSSISITRHELRFIGVDASDVDAIENWMQQSNPEVKGRTWTMVSLFYWIFKWLPILQAFFMVMAMFYATFLRPRRSKVYLAILGISAIAITLVVIMRYLIDRAVCGPAIDLSQASSWWSWWGLFRWFGYLVYFFVVAKIFDHMRREFRSFRTPLNIIQCFVIGGPVLSAGIAFVAASISRLWPLLFVFPIIVLICSCLSKSRSWLLCCLAVLVIAFIIPTNEDAAAPETVLKTSQVAGALLPSHEYNAVSEVLRDYQAYGSDFFQQESQSFDIVNAYVSATSTEVEQEARTATTLYHLDVGSVSESELDTASTEDITELAEGVVGVELDDVVGVMSSFWDLWQPLQGTPAHSSAQRSTFRKKFGLGSDAEKRTVEPDEDTSYPLPLPSAIRGMLPANVYDWDRTDVSKWAFSRFPKLLWRQDAEDSTWSQDLDLSRSFFELGVDGKGLLSMGPDGLDRITPRLGIHTKEHVLRAIRELNSRGWWSCVSSAESSWIGSLMQWATKPLPWLISKVANAAMVATLWPAVVLSLGMV